MSPSRQNSVKRVIAAMHSLRKTDSQVTTTDGYSPGRVVKSAEEYQQVIFGFLLQHPDKKKFNVELAPGLHEELAAKLILEEEQKTSEQMAPKTFTLQNPLTKIQKIKEAIQDFKRTHPGQKLLSFSCSDELVQELKANPTLCQELGLGFLSGDKLIVTQVTLSNFK